MGYFISSANSYRDTKREKGGIGGEVPKEKVDAIAEMLLPDIIAFFRTEEGKAVLEKWKKEQEEKKN